MSPKDQGSQSTSTCDRCRILKVKCHPADSSVHNPGTRNINNNNNESAGSSSMEAGPSGVSDTVGGEGSRGPCKRCLKAGHECTFDYEFKRSGRPPGSSTKRSRSKEGSSSRRSSSPPRRRPSISSRHSSSINPPSRPPSHQQHHHHQQHSQHGTSHAPHRSNSGQTASPGTFLDMQPPNPNAIPTPPFLPFSSPHDHTPGGQSYGHERPMNSLGGGGGGGDHGDHGDNGDTGDNGDGYSWGPIRDSIFGSARTALEGVGDTAQPWLSGLFNRPINFDFSLPEPTDHPEMSNTQDYPLNSRQREDRRTQQHTHHQHQPQYQQNISSGHGRQSTGSVHESMSMAGSSHTPIGASFGPSPSTSVGNASTSALGMLAATSTNTANLQNHTGGGGTGGNMMGINMGGMGGDRFVSSVPLPKSSDYFSDLGGPMQQVEAIGTWSEFCFFISLYMRHQHALVPLVHKPTFAMDVLHRRDQRDEAFRGLLFSIVTYTICQCPINMMSKDFSRERLLVLLERCQRASRVIQIRHLSRANLIVAASTELDILSSQATNKPELTAALFADAHRMQYTLRLNASQPAEGVSAIDVEMGRRIFWHLYSTDRTNVMNGGTMLIHHQEGLPPLPLEIDDEQLSNSTSHSLSRGHEPHSTYISGFITLLRIFIILGECQHRHRVLLNDPEMSQDLPTLNRWLDNAVDRLRRITDRLPAEFRAKEPKTDFSAVLGQSGGIGGIGGGGGGGMEDDSDATAGIQQANICITALCVEFALLDLRLALRPEEDLRPEREQIAKKAYATLSSIPLEYLASNGEAMRGKVLRTILALFNASTSPEELGDSVWDWWSMYSQVQFVQVIPAA